MLDEAIAKPLEEKFDKPIEVLEKKYGEEKEYPGNCPFLRHNQERYLVEKELLTESANVSKSK